MNVRVLQQAEAEVEHAARWYDDQRAGLGDDFLDAYAERLAEVEERPSQFSILETVKTKREVRRVLLRRFPYQIVYEVLSTEVLVIAVAHTSRRPNYWLRRRG